MNPLPGVKGVELRIDLTVKHFYESLTVQKDSTRVCTKNTARTVFPQPGLLCGRCGSEKSLNSIENLTSEILRFPVALNSPNIFLLVFTLLF